MATVEIGYWAYCTTSTCKNEEWHKVSEGSLSSYKTDKEGADEEGREFLWIYYNVNQAAKGNNDRFLKFRKLCTPCKRYLQVDNSLQPLQVKEVVPDTTYEPAMETWIDQNYLLTAGPVSFNMEEFAEQVEGGLGPDMQYNKGGQFENYDQKAMEAGEYDEAYPSDDDPLAPGANEAYEITKRAAKHNEEGRAKKLLGQSAPGYDHNRSFVEGTFKFKEY